jgi:hypothetical protein
MKTYTLIYTFLAFLIIALYTILGYILYNSYHPAPKSPPQESPDLVGTRYA